MTKTIADILEENFYDFVKGVLLTEKFSKMIEFENKIVFRVTKDTNKTMLKVLIEQKFNEKVKKINMLNDHRNIKKAIVTFEKEGVASEIASKLGVL